MAVALSYLRQANLAGQAGGAVTIRLGDSMVFAAATMSSNPRENIDFFPLTVDYEERMYAGGRIPGSFFRREGRPSTDAILTARLTDRPLRPLFAQEMRNEVQVIMFSHLRRPGKPAGYPVHQCRFRRLDDFGYPLGWAGWRGARRAHQRQVDRQPHSSPRLDSLDLDLRLAGTRDAILMVECGAEEDRR